MSSSLKDQLLKAGLVTEEQVAESEKKKPRRSGKPQNRANPKKPEKKKRKVKTDLELFYAERARQEKQEKRDSDKRKRELAALKKERNRKTRELINRNQLDTEAGSIRYNFVVGTTVKYLFVTEEQQQQLIEGKLAITFNGGKRCLVPLETGHKIVEIDPDKIVIFPAPGDASEPENAES